MNKKTGKKWIAMLCAVLLLPWSLWVSGATGPDEVWAAVPENLEKWTIADACLADGEYGNFTTPALDNVNENMVGKAFTTMIRLNKPDVSGDSLWIGKSSSTTGFLFQARKDGSIGFTHYMGSGNKNTTIKATSEGCTTTISGGTVLMTAANAGVSSLVDTTVQLTLTVEAIEGEGSKYKVGVFFNDQLYENSYFTIETTTDKMPKTLTGQDNDTTNTMYLAVPESEREAELPTWTIADAGLTDGDRGAFGLNQSLTYANKSMLNTVFTTVIKFKSNTNYGLYVGKSGTGFLFQTRNDGTVGFTLYDPAYTSSNKNNTIIAANGNTSTALINTGNNGTVLLSKDYAGLDSLYDVELKLTLTVESIPDDASRVKVGVYFNDKLYADTYFIIQTTADKLPMNLQGVANVAGSTTYLAVPESAQQVITHPAELDAWTPETVGFTYGNFTSYKKGTAVANATLNGTAFRATITYPENIAANNAVNLWIGDSEGGSNCAYLIQASPTHGGQLQFQYYPGRASNTGNYTLKLNPQDASLASLNLTTFLGTVLDLTITTEFTSVSIDGTKADVNVGIYINGILYGGSYYKLWNVDVAAFAKRNMILRAGSDTVVLGTPDIQEVMFGDLNYNNVINSVDLILAKKMMARGQYTKTLDFYNLEQNSAEDLQLLRKVLIGADTSIQYHTQLGFADFGQETNYTVAPTGEINGHETLSASTGSLDGVWVEGIYGLSGTPLIYIGNTNGGLQLKRTGDSTLTYNYIDYSNNDRPGGITASRNTFTAEEDTFLDSVKIGAGFTFRNVDAVAGTTDVIVEVQIGDDYRDRISVQDVKTSNLNRKLDLQAPANPASSITLKVAEEDPTLTFAFLGGSDVMPIGGYYGPAVQDKGSANIDQFTDDIFTKIADLGVNLLVYPNADYNNSERSELVKTSLALGEKHGIGLFVRDDAISANQYTTADGVRSRLSQYNTYKSYCGNFVVDEPTSADWKSDITDRYIDKFAPVYQNLNQLGVTGYVNLNPIKSGTDTDYANYTNYVEAFCTTCNPAYLCFDYYVWDSDCTKAGYFRNMSIIREKAQENRIPFWSYVQAGSNWNDAGGDLAETTNPRVTEAELLWSVNTALACGAKGIKYFPLIQPEKFAYVSQEGGTYDYNRNGLIGANGETNQWYGYAQKANTQIQAVDEILMHVVSKGILVNGTNATADTANFTDRISGSTYKELTGVNEGAEVLIGCFEYCGKTALYVTNYQTSVQKVTLTFNGDYSLKQTVGGNTSTLTTTNQTLTLNMAGGEGRLLVIG